MGVDDLMAARNMVMAAMKTTELKRIDYQTFNSLQKVGDTAMEARYNTLLQRVGSTVSFDPDLVNIHLNLLCTSNFKIKNFSKVGFMDLDKLSLDKMVFWF
jgi:hypothetical protein